MEDISAKEKKPSVRVLSFNLGQEHYCADIRQVKEVVKAGLPAKVPNTPDYIAGVMSLRGQIIAVVDLRHFFGSQAPKAKQEPVVIVSDAAGPLVGILVDGTKESVDVDEDAIQPPLETISKELLKYTRGQVQIGNDFIAVIDLKKILENEEMNKLRKGG